MEKTSIAFSLKIQEKWLFTDYSVETGFEFGREDIVPYINFAPYSDISIYGSLLWCKILTTYLKLSKLYYERLEVYMRRRLKVSNYESKSLFRSRFSLKWVVIFLYFH